METRSLGGVLLAFAGLVLLIAGFRGTLQKVWQDATGIGAPAAPKAGSLGPTPPPIKDTGGLENSIQSVSGLLYGLPTGYAGTGNVLPGGVPVSTYQA